MALRAVTRSLPSVEMTTYLRDTILESGEVDVNKEGRKVHRAGYTENHAGSEWRVCREHKLLEQGSRESANGVG